MDMMKDLTMEVLSNSVVGEETIIEQGPITVYAKMSESKKQHELVTVRMSRSPPSLLAGHRVLS